MALIKDSDGFNPFAAGKKRYGGGRDAPNIGMTLDPLGYAERDASVKARNNAILRRMKANQQGRFISPDWLRGSNGT
jgi:hypothetical protein